MWNRIEIRAIAWCIAWAGSLVLSGCVTYDAVHTHNDAAMSSDAAIVVFRTVTAANMITTTDAGFYGVAETRQDRAIRSRSRYLLRDIDDKNAVDITDIKDDLHVIRIWGGIERPFVLQYVQPLLTNSRSWRGLVSHKIAFKLPKGNAVYYLGQIHIDGDGNLRLEEDYKRDMAEMYESNPYLQHYGIERVALKLFPSETNDRQIDRAFGLPR